MPKGTVMTMFWRSRILSAKFGQIHVAVTIITADNHVPQFPKGRPRELFLANNC